MADDRDALVAPGGWCAPLGPIYQLTLRLCDSWDQDWNALVAPRFTRVQRWFQRRRAVRRWKRLARRARHRARRYHGG